MNHQGNDKTPSSAADSGPSKYVRHMIGEIKRQEALGAAFIKLEAADARVEGFIEGYAQSFAAHHATGSTAQGELRAELTYKLNQAQRHLHQGWPPAKVAEFTDLDLHIVSAIKPNAF